MDQRENSFVDRTVTTPKKTGPQLIGALIVILLLLGGGYGLYRYLLDNKPEAKKQKPPKMQTLVEVQRVRAENVAVTIEALGQVVAAREVNLQARVSGEITYLHPNFLPGGLVKKGEVLVKLDDTDYRLVLGAKQNALAVALADLRIEEGNNLVAGEEWRVVNAATPGIDDSSIDLALRKPQMDKATAAADAARIELKKAEEDLSRTVLRAPFNAVIRQKNVDSGSQISAQTVLGVLTDIDTYRAELAIPVDKLPWFALPVDGKPGAAVAVLSGAGQAFPGIIAKLKPEVDPQGLMATLLVDIPDPLGLTSGRAALLLGSYIQAEITGKTLDMVFRIPRAALREGDKVLTVTPEETLRINQVTVVWKAHDFVLIEQGLAAGDQVIVSNVAAPIEGMKLKIAGKAAGKETKGHEQ